LRGGRTEKAHHGSSIRQTQTLKLLPRVGGRQQQEISRKLKRTICHARRYSHVADCDQHSCSVLAIVITLHERGAGVSAPEGRTHRHTAQSCCQCPGLCSRGRSPPASSPPTPPKQSTRAVTTPLFILEQYAAVAELLRSIHMHLLVLGLAAGNIGHYCGVCRSAVTDVQVNLPCPK